MDPQQTSVKWSKRRLQQLKKHTPAMLVASAGDLQKALAACEASGMTLVLIDTPPHVEAPCREAAKLADLVVIPCGPRRQTWKPSAPPFIFCRRRNAGGHGLEPGAARIEY